MSDQTLSSTEKDEIDEILIKNTSGRTVVKSLAEKALSFYRQRKTDFLFYEDYYNTHKSNAPLEAQKHENSSRQESPDDERSDQSTMTTINELRNENQKLREENTRFQKMLKEMDRAFESNNIQVNQTEIQSEKNASSVQNITHEDVDRPDQQNTTYAENLESRTWPSKSPEVHLAFDATTEVNHHDKYTPANIAERFKHLYEVEWKQAFNGLLKNNPKESLLIDSLAEVLKEIDKFCTSIGKQQLESMKKHVLEELTYPKYRLESGDVVGGLHRALVEEQQHALANKHLRELRKHLGSLSVGPLYQIFSNLQTQLPGASETMSLFIMQTTELIWMMNMQEPPMGLEWANPGLTFEQSKYKVYKDTGSIVQQCVWPAVLQYSEGPVMSQGVVLVK